MRVEHWVYTIPLRLRSLLRRNRVEQELDEELRFHLECRIDAAMARGADPEDARREALRAMNGVEQRKEECRDLRGVSAVEHFVRDAGYALRMFRKSPGFAVVAVLTLALGIGANTALFSVMDAVLMRSLPVSQPAGLFFLSNTGSAGQQGGPPYPCFDLFRKQASSFADMAAFSADSRKMIVDGRLEQVVGQYASGSYFEVLGVRPVLGRVLTAADERLDPPVAVISYAYWQRRFGGSPAVLGKVMRVDKHSLVIAGVTAPEFFGLEPGWTVDVTFPITLRGAQALSEKGSWWMNIVARLKPGVPPAQARAEVDGVFQNFMSEVKVPPEIRREYFHHIELVPASKGLDTLRRQFSRPLLVLMTVVGLILLIGCANLANMLLARAAARRREFALRLAIGAERGRLIRQLLTETMLLFACGATIGLLFARWVGGSLMAFFAVGRKPIQIDLHLDIRVLAFTALLTLGTGLLFGLMPALRAARTDPYPALKEVESRTTASLSRIGMGRILVVTQVALSLVLLVTSGLLVRTLANLEHLDPGFHASGVLTLSVEPSDAYGAQQRIALWMDLLARARKLPGVRSASLSALTPLSGRDRGIRIDVPGFQPRSEHDNAIHSNHVSDEYFETLRIPLLRGRAFTTLDRDGMSRVAVLNEAAARFYFKGRNPLGAKLRLSWRSGLSYEVVGVVQDAKYDSLRRQPERFIYVPIFQPHDDLGRLTLAVRTDGDSTTLVSILRREIGAAGKNILITDVMTLQQQIDASLLQERLVSTLSAFFGALALLLSAIGLYGVVSYAVVQRTNEIGIRMALGAGTGGVVWMVLRESLALAGIGVLIGVPAAALAVQPMASLLFGLKPADPATFATGAVLLLTTAAVASYLPARRAARIDPIRALREE